MGDFDRDAARDKGVEQRSGVLDRDIKAAGKRGGGDDGAAARMSIAAAACESRRRIWIAARAANQSHSSRRKMAMPASASSASAKRNSAVQITVGRGVGQTLWLRSPAVTRSATAHSVANAARVWRERAGVRRCCRARRAPRGRRRAKAGRVGRPRAPPRRVRSLASGPRRGGRTSAITQTHGGRPRRLRQSSLLGSRRNDREAARHRAGGGTDGQGATAAALLPSRCFGSEKVDFGYRVAAPPEAVRRPLPHIHDQCGSEASKTRSAGAAHARIDDAERAGLDQPLG